MSTCKFAAMFGRPGEGAHAIRLFDVAVVDVAATVAVALLIARFALKWPIASLRTLALTLSLFLLGILAHRAFCVRTRVDRWLFPGYKADTPR